MVRMVKWKTREMGDQGNGRPGKWEAIEMGDQGNGGPGKLEARERFGEQSREKHFAREIIRNHVQRDRKVAGGREERVKGENGNLLKGN